MSADSTIDGAPIQAALDAIPCAPGDVMSDFSPNGTRTCIPQSPDVVNQPQTLNPATQIDLGAGPLGLQNALATGCPVDQVLSNFAPDGSAHLCASIA